MTILGGVTEIDCEEASVRPSARTLQLSEWLTSARTTVYVGPVAAAIATPSRSQRYDTA